MSEQFSAGPGVRHQRRSVCPSAEHELPDRPGKFAERDGWHVGTSEGQPAEEQRNGKRDFTFDCAVCAPVACGAGAGRALARRRQRRPPPEEALLHRRVGASLRGCPPIIAGWQVTSTSTCVISFPPPLRLCYRMSLGACSGGACPWQRLRRAWTFACSACLVLSRACASVNKSASGRKSLPGSMSRPRTGRASSARPTLCAATPFVTRTAEVLDEPPPIALRRSAQPTPHRRRRHSDCSADPAMPRSARVRGQRSLNPFRRRRSAQQHGHRQQHVRHCARPASRPAWPHQTLHASNLPRPCFPSRRARRPRTPRHVVDVGISRIGSMVGSLSSFGQRTDHRVARPTKSGCTIRGMPRHTTSSVVTANPQARINSPVGRLQQHPPAKRRHGSNR